MEKGVKEEAEARKRAIYDRLSGRRRKYIDKIGYERWDPFQGPKEPIEIRRDKSKRTTQMLVREFLQSRPLDNYSNSYGRGALDFAMGIINEDERYLAMLDFARWYLDLLQREGHEE
jgi:hypothetical protein